MKKILRIQALVVIAGLTMAVVALPELKRSVMHYLNGSASAPSQAFITDTDTGTYRAAADTYGIAGGGASAATFTPGTLTLTKSSGANLLTSATSAATMTASVPAWRMKSSVTPDTNDMLWEVMYGTTSVMSVDKEGDLTIATATIGGGTPIVKITSEVVLDQDIGAVAAATTGTLAVSVAGATLGDSVICQSVQDDAAWDECSLNCYVESAGIVKMVVHADATGCDPAVGNDYRFTLLRF